MVVLLRLAACSAPLLIGLTSRCFAHWARASCAPRHYHPQFAMVVPHLRTALAFGGAVFRGCALRFASCARHSSPSGLRCAALPCSLGLLRPVSRTARGLRAPHQFPLKSYGFPGAETARKRFLLWKMGFSAAAYCEPLHPSIQHGRSTALASSLAELPASLGLLRPVSRTARGLRAPPPYTPPGTIEV